jgi:type VI secretion system protein ImpF
MAGPRINPTLFDKLVADHELAGLRDDEGGERGVDVSQFRYFSVPRIERFNETALRNTIRRELNWLLNTTCLGASQDLEPYPQVKTSVLNFGVPDLAGKLLQKRVVQARAREIRDAIKTFEPRIDPKRLDVDPQASTEKPNAVTYVIRGDVTAAVNALPVVFKTDVEIDTGAATLRD